MENHAGVLSRISGLFAKKNLNIESINASPTKENPEITIMTVSIEGDEFIADLATESLDMFEEVLEIERIK
jgi:acetolactate synthase-1/3 small subunit